VALKTIVVAGTPGAGKSTVLSKVSIPKVKIVNLGDLMLKYTKLSDRDSLRSLPIKEQIKTRYKAINDLSKKSGIFVVDTHLTVKKNAQYLPGFSTNELKKLGLLGIIYIDAKSEDIIRRRQKDKTRKREQESEDEISMQRLANLSIMAAISTELNVPFFIVSNNEGELEKAAEEASHIIKELIL